MEKREIVCIVCPIGCRLEIVEDEKLKDGYKVSGAQCRRGNVYGIKEISNPTRLLTTTVRIKGAPLPRLPVRTDKEIPKDKIFACMDLINQVKLEAPVEMGEIIIKNILDMGVNIVASRSFK